VPRPFLPILYINPFSYMTWCYQDVIYFGRFEHPWAWLVFAVISLGTFVLGARLFARLKPTLAGAL
jgi:lipopolysaccharide transport system permease protein